MLTPGQFTKFAMTKEALIFGRSPVERAPGIPFSPTIGQQESLEKLLRSAGGRVRGALEGAIPGAGLGALIGAPLGPPGMAAFGSLGALAGGSYGSAEGARRSSIMAKNKFLSDIEQSILRSKTRPGAAQSGLYEALEQAVRKGTGAAEAGVAGLGDLASRGMAAGGELAGRAQAGMGDLMARLPPGALQRAGLGAGAGLGAYGLYKLLGGGAE